MTDETPRGRGRPSKYEPEMCEQVINLMAGGLSLTAAAAMLNIHRDTVYAWESEIPEFSDAVKLARGKRTLKLELDLLAASDGPTVTSRIFALKNACAEEWREKQDFNIGNQDGKPFKMDGKITLSGPDLPFPTE